MPRRIMMMTMIMMAVGDVVAEYLRASMHPNCYVQVRLKMAAAPRSLTPHSLSLGITSSLNVHVLSTSQPIYSAILTINCMNIMEKRN